MSQPSHQGPSAVAGGVLLPRGAQHGGIAGDEDVLETEDGQEEGKLRSWSA